MNGSFKWIAGVASALVVAIVGWLFHTVHDLDKSVAAMAASMKDAAADVAEIKADLKRDEDDIEDLQKKK